MQFDFNLGPGASQTIDVKGRFFKYKAGTGPIRIRTSTGGAVDLLPGQGVENVAFTSLTVSDRSGANNVGAILAGDFDFRDDRISGTVDVVDGGKSRTLANMAFYPMASSTAAAGQWGSCQLWNPVGSGKNIILSAYGFQTDVATGIRIRGSTAPLGTNLEKPPSKKLGGAVSVMEIYSGPNGAVPMTNYFPGATMAANSTIDKVLREPIVIPPGAGLFVYTIALNVNLFANFEYHEEPVTP